MGRRIHFLLLLLAFPMLVSGCAASKPDGHDGQMAAEQATDGWVDELNGGLGSADEPVRDEIVCRRQRPAGAHATRMICKPRWQMDMERERALSEVGFHRTISGDERRY